MGQFRREGGSDRGSRDFGGSRGGYDRPRSFGGARDEKVMHRATCAECGRSCEVPFKPTGDKPVYCSECFGNQQESAGYGRDSRRESRSFDRPKFEDKKMFSATCDKCGEKCEVPFRPTSGKPVFCDTCHRSGDTRSAGKSSVDYKDSFATLNAKLDRIIKALNIPASKPTTIKDEIAELIEEIASATPVAKKGKKEKVVKEKAVKAKVEKKATKVVKAKAEPKKKAVAKKK